MKVLGIRVDPTMTRYALVEYDGSNFVLLNATTESRLVYPADVERPEEKVHWLYRELDRLFHDHHGVEKVCIKTNEYTRMDTKPKRESAYLEGAVLLFCREKKCSRYIKNICLTFYS